MVLFLLQVLQYLLGLVWILVMAEEEELLRMSRLLIADDIAYRQQLETAVSTIFTLSFSHESASHFVIPQLLYSNIK